LNRKYTKYSDYVKNVVNNCSHEWLIMDNVHFRAHRIDKFQGVNSELPKGKLIRIIPARCKSYSCKICGKKKVYDLLDRLRHVDLRGYRFFTLTLRNEYSKENTEKNLNRISECFNKLNKKLRKMDPYKKLEYFRVTEVGNDGMVHIHGLWNIYIPIKTLGKIWFDITGDSFKVKPERVKSKKDAMKYLFKYLTKNIQPAQIDEYDNDFFGLDLVNTAKLFYENGKRRYQASRKFFPKAVKKTTEFLPYYFESEDSPSIEKTIKSLVENFGLKREHFDFSLYDNSDLFLQNLFDSS